jgi:hypothetical protein
MSDISHVFRISYVDRGWIRFQDLGNPSKSDYGVVVDERPLVRNAGARLSDRLADLVDLAAFVNLSDRRAKRANRDQRWSRTIEIEAPLRDADFWCDHTISQATADILWHYTGDTWKLKPYPRGEQQRNSELQLPLLSPPMSDDHEFALFSGGLDSLAGLVRSATVHPSRHFYLVSAQTSSRLVGVQKQAVEQLRGIFGQRFVLLPVRFSLRGRSDDPSGDEKSQRTRGFSYAVIGAVAALASDVPSLTIHENGIGAINLPQTEGQLAFDLTRATNPAVLVQMEHYLQTITGISFSLNLPNLFTTKAELCSLDRGEAVGSIFAASVSCDHYPLRQAAAECGVCSSCILRRQALFCSGFTRFDSSTSYRYDVFRERTPSTGNRTAPLTMLYQVSRLNHALQSDAPWQAISSMFPELVDVSLACSNRYGGEIKVRELLLGLYRRYCVEWGDFSAAIPFLERQAA